MVLHWGYPFSNGKLSRMAAGAWGVWSLLGLGLAVTLNRGPATEVGVGSVVLFLSWVLDGAAFLYLLGVLVKNFRLTSREGRQLLSLMAILVTLIGGSGWLAAHGFARFAVLVAAGPLTVVGTGYALFLGIILVAGRNSRWN
jgi:hypothetical protein